MKNHGIFISISAFILILAAAFVGSLAWAVSESDEPIVEAHHFLSTILKNTDGTSTVVSYRAILPAGYNPHEKYPVVYFLHGRGSDSNMLEYLGAVDQLKELNAHGNFPKFIVISPHGGDNFWINGAHDHQRWADMIQQELVPQVERTYPTLETCKGRLLAGISMGGYGALHMVQHQKSCIFGSVVAHSPVLRDAVMADQNGYDPIFGEGEEYLDRDVLSYQVRHPGAFSQTPVWIDMAGDDALELYRTKAFSDLIRGNCMKHWIHIGDNLMVGGQLYLFMGGHTVTYWKKNMSLYLQEYAQLLFPGWSPMIRTQLRTPTCHPAESEST